MVCYLGLHGLVTPNQAIALQLFSQAAERLPRTESLAYLASARLQAIEKAAPGIRLFWDVEGLRSGENWNERLAEEVISKDVFYLFWSENAAPSKWVSWEWQCAYQERGIDYIDPFPWMRQRRHPNWKFVNLLTDRFGICATKS